MNALAQRIARLIEMQGPISIAQFMTLALHDPQGGYYAARDPLGAEGDFITAPEISQMFGELLGLWCVQAWRDQGCPSPARLVELGPGRGTLMADALRAAKRDAQFLASIEVVLIETSASLREAQAERLKDSAVPARSLARFDDSLTDRPVFLLANEFFDALPIRQFVFTERGWCERMVGVDRAGALTFALSPAPLPLDVPAGRGQPELGAVYETCPSGETFVEQIASILAEKGGAALVVDYGYGARSGFGETLQGVAAHKYASVLDNPGAADLSAHVDFAALARIAINGGAKTYGPVGQGEFLIALGIVQRAQRLAMAHSRGSRGLDQQPQLKLQLDRLILPDQMGALFKALAILPKNAPPPAGFSS